jgi:hypothetical protein
MYEGTANLGIDIKDENMFSNFEYQVREKDMDAEVQKRENSIGEESFCVTKF